jgi:hypothetical protein
MQRRAADVSGRVLHLREHPCRLHPRRMAVRGAAVRDRGRRPSGFCAGRRRLGAPHASGLGDGVPDDAWERGARVSSIRWGHQLARRVHGRLAVRRRDERQVPRRVARDLQLCVLVRHVRDGHRLPHARAVHLSRIGHELRAQPVPHEQQLRHRLRLRKPRVLLALPWHRALLRRDRVLLPHVERPVRERLRLRGK